MNSLIADNVIFEQEYHGIYLFKFIYILLFGYLALLFGLGVGMYGGQNLTILGNTMLNILLPPRSQPPPIPSPSSLLSPLGSHISSSSFFLTIPIR